jgi:hypothetical protein
MDLSYTSESNAIRRSLGIALVTLTCAGCLVGSTAGGPDGSTPSPDRRDGGAFCTTPLGADAGPATLDDLPLATWCAVVPGGASEWTAPCGGYLGVDTATGVDCFSEYVFDATSRRLVATIAGCNLNAGCVEGEPSFRPPTDPDAGWPDSNCLVARASVDLCAQMGFPPRPAGAGAPCMSASDCPSGYRCVYTGMYTGPCHPAPACGIQDGTCLSALDLSTRFPACTPIEACACDGTTTQGCVDPKGHGYFPTLVALPVPPSTCGGTEETIPLDAGLAACGADM